MCSLIVCHIVIKRKRMSKMLGKKNRLVVVALVLLVICSMAAPTANAFQKDSGAYSSVVTFDRKHNQYVVAVSSTFKSITPCLISYTGKSFNNQSQTGTRPILLTPLLATESIHIQNIWFSGLHHFEATVQCHPSN